MKKTILVFTGGGLVSVLNASLYGVISRAQEKGFRVLGGLCGWKSLLPGGKIIDLTETKIDILKDQGGTFLRSSRTNPLGQKDGVEFIKKRMKELDIDALVPIGGNDTLGAARQLAEKFRIPLIGIPKTTDNDLSATYWTPGFPSAAAKIGLMAKQIKEEAAYALSRIFLIETMGMRAGWVAASSFWGNPDLILVPEREISLDSVLEKLNKKYKENGDYATVVLAEEVRFDKEVSGIIDSQPDQFVTTSRQSLVSLGLREKIKKELGVDTKIVMPRSYLQVGPPVEIDKRFAILLGEKAVDLVEIGKTGLMNCIVRPDESKREFEVSSVSLNKVVGEENHRVLDDKTFNFEEFQVTAQFRDYLTSIIGKPTIENKEYKDLIDKVLNI